MLNEGIYIAENNDNMFNAYKIKIHVKETGESYIFKLIDFDSRYSGVHMERAFAGKDKLIIKKNKSKHAMRIWGDNDFTIYPFQAGIPYYFRREGKYDV